jgi:hypothetical protein
MAPDAIACSICASVKTKKLRLSKAAKTAIQINGPITAIVNQPHHFMAFPSLAYKNTTKVAFL